MTEDIRVLADIRQEQGSVFLALDSGEILELAPDSVPRQLPDIGESISSPLLAEIRLAAERKQVARRIFTLLDRKLQPVVRIRSKLDELGFSEDAVTSVLGQMQAQGLYSDQHYAEAYCRDVIRGKAVGRLYLEKKLREKGVPAPMARSVPGQVLNVELERELAETAAAGRWRRERTRDHRKAEAKVIRYLAGRGFPMGLAVAAARAAAPRATGEEF